MAASQRQAPPHSDRMRKIATTTKTSTVTREHAIVSPLTIGREEDAEEDGVLDDDDFSDNDHGHDVGDEFELQCRDANTGIRRGGVNCPRRTITYLVRPFLSDESADDPAQIVRGFCTLALFGTILGLIMPPNTSLPTPWYRTTSSIIGYTYTLCWSVALYPQIYSNYRRRTTTGLSPEFVLWNVLGFACYGAYTAAFYWSDAVRETYARIHDGAGEVTVQGNDVAHGVHLWILSMILWGQIVHYDGDRWWRDVSTSNKCLLCGTLGVCVTYPISVLLQLDGSTWYDYLYLLSYVKVWTTLIKYVPQALLNARRKSTIGWSIWRVLLDLAGGILSTLQLFGDAADFGDWREGVLGNPAKLGLGCVSMAFAVLFMIQHYVLYPSSISSSVAAGEETARHERLHSSEKSSSSSSITPAPRPSSKDLSPLL